ncbi:MAG: hypothetical protein Q4F84_10315, partial [Fibrobacter sp.]|nr:hypothetical protein [Fibrobacter sp.]
MKNNTRKFVCYIMLFVFVLAAIAVIIQSSKEKSIIPDNVREEFQLKNNQSGTKQAKSENLNEWEKIRDSLRNDPPIKFPKKLKKRHISGNAVYLYSNILFDIQNRKEILFPELNGGWWCYINDSKNEGVYVILTTDLQENDVISVTACLADLTAKTVKSRTHFSSKKNSSLCISRDCSYLYECRLDFIYKIFRYDLNSLEEPKE